MNLPADAPLEPVLPGLFGRLLELLTGSEPEIRRGALIALSRLQGETAGAVLFEQYQSDNLEEYLALAVNRLDPERASQALIHALADPNPEARFAAAMALSQNRHEASVRVLTDTIDLYLSPDKNDTVKGQALLSEEALISAIRVLGEIGQRLCLAQLHKLVLKEPNPRIRASAAAALGRHITEALLPIFQGLLKDQDARVRANAVEAIGTLRTPKVVAILQAFLYDSNQRVRANAIKAIWQYGDFEVTSTIKEMLADPSKLQRVSGIYAIGEIRCQPFLKALLPYLQNPEADVRRNAVIALRKFGRNESSKTLVKLLGDPEPEVRTQVVLALVEVFGGEALPMLLPQLDTEEAPAVLAVLLPQLARMSEPKLVNRMVGYLEWEEERIISAAIEAISRLRPEAPPATLMQSLQKLLRSSSQRVRTQAIRALWNWGHNAAIGHVLPMMQDSSPDIARRGLTLLGDIFGMVSEQRGDEATLFERFLRQAVDERRRSLAGERHFARRELIQEKFARAQIHLQANQVQEAEALLLEIFQDDPSHLGALVGLGDIQFKAGRFKEAIQSFELALRLQPNLTKAYYALGQIYHRNGAWGLAGQMLGQTVRLHPKLPQAWVLLAESLEKSGRREESIVALQHLHALVPKNPGALSRLARAFFLARRIGEGISWARQAALLGANDPTTTLILATGDLLGNQTQEGSRRLLHLLKTATDQPERFATQDFQQLLPIVEEAIARKSS